MTEIRLADLQLAIMDVLWARGSATVSDVHGALLEARGLAPTTIATMLTKLEKKGVVRHESEGRRYVYFPCVSRGEVQTSMTSQLTERLFGGRASALVAHLLDEHEVSDGELQELRKLISEAERKDPRGTNRE